MTNMFDEVLNNAKGMEEKLLGPPYPYYKNIKAPNELGMSDKGTIQQMGKNVNGLIEYVNLLVSGKSKASATGGPLGNKFFLKTGAKCTNQQTQEEEDRYIYINNVPQGNIPFISQGLGTNFTEFRGLIPGTMSDLNVLNPFALLSAFMVGSKPPCQELTMQTISADNVKSNESHYVTLVDIQNMDPCNFTDRKNPITSQKCKETFATIYNNNNSYPFPFPQDMIIQFIYFCLLLIVLYLFYNALKK